MKHYKKFLKELEKAADSVDLKNAIGTSRKGKARLRDHIVTGKMSWTEALSYVAIIQSIIIFIALIPNSIDTINGFLRWIGFSFQLPRETSSVVAVLFVVGVFIFGLIAVRYVGTIKRTWEIGSKMHPGHIVFFEILEDIRLQMDSLSKKLDELKRENEKS